MDLTTIITSTYGYQHRLTEIDIPAVAYGCQLMMEDYGIEDEDGALSAQHMRQIAQEFPQSADRSVYIYTTCRAVMEQVQQMFEDLAKK